MCSMCPLGSFKCVIKIIFEVHIVKVVTAILSYKVETSLKPGCFSGTVSILFSCLSQYWGYIIFFQSNGIHVVKMTECGS